jgi:hypothetical protein
VATDALARAAVVKSAAAHELAEALRSTGPDTMRRHLANCAAFGLMSQFATSSLPDWDFS